MNEKIKLLAEQAEECIEMSMPDEIYHMGTGVFRRYKTFNKEKFAELIIKECLCIISGKEIFKDDTEYDQGYNKALKVVYNDITDKLGVEE